MVPALERGLGILELLAEHPGGLFMSEMKSLGLPPASLYRMLVTLTELGYVIRDEGDRYRLGRKLLSLGYKGLEYASLPEKSAFFLRSLRNSANETVAIGVLSGGEGVVLDTVRSQQAVCVYVQVGHNFPLHTAAPAKAILAFLPEDEQEAFLNRISFSRFTEKTITDRKQYAAELRRVKACGIAYDMGEEARDLRCVAAPVFDSRGYPVAAVWITGPESRLDAGRLEELGVLVRETAEKIGNCII